jgi:hypothetical protein
VLRVLVLWVLVVPRVQVLRAQVLRVRVLRVRTGSTLGTFRTSTVGTFLHPWHPQHYSRSTVISVTPTGSS